MFFGCCKRRFFLGFIFYCFIGLFDFLGFIYNSKAINHQNCIQILKYFLAFVFINAQQENFLFLYDFIYSNFVPFRFYE